MRQNDLLCRPRRRWVKTTQSDHPYPVFPNVVRNLVTTSVDQVWLADITYIRILTAFVYLAVILDMHSRKTLGYAISSRVDTELTLRALRMALTQRNPPWGWYPSLRPRGSICCPCVCGFTQGTWIPNQHVTKRQSFRQCHG